MTEKTNFKKDSKTKASEKNTKLATHLNGTWNQRNIVSIKRIEIGPDSGWEVTYRTK